MTEGKCAIWGTPAEHEPSISRVLEIDSPRAGGRYKISFEAISALDPFTASSELLAKLTTWLVDERLSGIEAPYITIDVIQQEMLTRKLLSTSERVSKFFTYCEKYKNRAGDYVFNSINNNSKYNLDVEFYDFTVMAYCEFLKNGDFIPFCSLLSDMGYISDFKLTYRAFERIDALSNSNANSKQAFVAMWFDGKMDNVYAKGIQPAIEGENFKPVRIDREHHTKNIIDFMIGEIKRSKFVVADFTSMILKDGDDRDRQVDIGGVYFEAGYALGLNIPVIWTCHKDHSGSIHFDLKQFNTIFYTDPDDLKLKLSTRIRAMFVS